LINGLAEAFNQIALSIQNAIDAAAPFIEMISSWGEENGIVLNLPVIFNTAWQLIVEAFVIYPAIIIGLVSGFINGVIGFFQELKDRIIGNSIVPDMMQEIYDEMTGKFDEIIAYISETWVVQTLASIVGWALLVVGPGGVIPTAMSDIWTAITTKMDETKTEWDTRWTAFKTSVDDMWNGGDGIIAKIDTAIQAVAAFFGLDGTLATAISNFINSIIVWATEQIGLLADALLGLKAQWDAIKGILGIELQSGGPALKGGSYIVGEAGREMFIPAESGFVLPNWMTERMLAPQMSSGATSNTYITNVEVNPSYKNVQSEASLYYDVTAALAASRR
jgi:hypothetical protein